MFLHHSWGRAKWRAVDWRENMCGCRTICRILSRAYHIAQKWHLFYLFCCLFRTLLPVLYNSLCLLRGNVAACSIALRATSSSEMLSAGRSNAMQMPSNELQTENEFISQTLCRCVCFFSCRCSSREVFHRRCWHTQLMPSYLLRPTCRHNSSTVPTRVGGFYLHMSNKFKYLTVVESVGVYVTQSQCMFDWSMHGLSSSVWQYGWESLRQAHKFLKHIRKQWGKRVNRWMQNLLELPKRTSAQMWMGCNGRTHSSIWELQSWKESDSNTNVMRRFPVDGVRTMAAEEFKANLLFMLFHCISGSMESICVHLTSICMQRRCRMWIQSMRAVESVGERKTIHSRISEIKWRKTLSVSRSYFIRFPFAPIHCECNLHVNCKFNGPKSQST